MEDRTATGYWRTGCTLTIEEDGWAAVAGRGSPIARLGAIAGGAGSADGVLGHLDRLQDLVGRGVGTEGEGAELAHHGVVASTVGDALDQVVLVEWEIECGQGLLDVLS